MAIMTVQADTAEFRFGTQSLKCTTGTTGNNAIYPQDDVEVIPGEYRTFSVYIKTQAAMAGGSIYLRVAQGGLLTPVLAESDAITDTSEAEDGWQRVIVSLFVPAGVFTVRPFIQYSGSTAGQVFWLDGVKLEKGDTASQWQENIVSTRTIIDQQGVIIDGASGGIFRLRGSGGGQRHTVSLSAAGLSFGGDVEVYSDASGELKVGGDLEVTGDIYVDDITADDVTVDQLTTNGAFAPFSITGLSPVVNVYTANATWNKPSKLHHIVVECVGGGGGGGGAASGAAVSVGGGGGGGGYARKVFLASALPSSCTVVRGAGGAGGAAGANDGNNGAASTFAGTGITTVSGGGGLLGAGQANGSAMASAAGGGGGSSSGGDINVVGSDGSLGLRVSGTGYIPGNGGASGGGFGGMARGNATDAGGNGTTGSQYGGGGAGGHNGGGAGAASGGDGANGVVIVTEFYGP